MTDVREVICRPFGRRVLWFFAGAGGAARRQGGAARPGGDGDTVPSSWHIAELDDAGTPVRLAAAPDDLTRILRELASGRTPANAGCPDA